jgi:hypothetical protein
MLSSLWWPIRLQWCWTSCFTAAASTQLWVADITFGADLGGVQPAFVTDAYTRRIAGRSVAR